MKRFNAIKITLIVIVSVFMVLIVLPQIILFFVKSNYISDGKQEYESVSDVDIRHSDSHDDTDNKAQSIYDQFVKQPYVTNRENARNQGELFASAPEELSSRVNEYYEGPDSISLYWGAKEPVKVASTEDEFVRFCDRFFFDHPDDILYIKWADEIYLAQCNGFSIYRSELFNPTEKNGNLYYTIDGHDDGMPLTTLFVYDSTGKYAMICENSKEYSYSVLAKFIGLQFTEDHPYISPMDDELLRLSTRNLKPYSGNINDYVVKSIVRVHSLESEFMEYSDSLFANIDYSRYYQYDETSGEVSAVECGANYVLLRSEFLEPLEYKGELLYVGPIIGDCEPPTCNFYYDATGKYALAYFGSDNQDKVLLQHLGFE